MFKITSTDTPRILGLSPFGGPADVWAEKVSGRRREVSGPHIDRGLRLEAQLLDRVAVALGVEVEHAADKLFTAADAPWLACHVDGIAADGRIVEVKTTRMPLDRWIRERWAGYFAQVQHQLRVLGRKDAVLAVHTAADNSIKIFPVSFDPDWWGEAEAVLERFRRAVEARDFAIFSGRGVNDLPTAFIDDGRVEAVRAELEALKEERRRLDARIKEAEAELRDLLPPGGVAFDPAGRPLAKRIVVFQRRFDAARFRKEHPEIAEKFVKYVQFERLILPKIKE